MAPPLFHSIWNNIVSNLPQWDIPFCKNEWKSGGAIRKVIPLLHQEENAAITAINSHAQEEGEVPIKPMGKRLMTHTPSQPLSTGISFTYALAHDSLSNTPRDQSLPLNIIGQLYFQELFLNYFPGYTVNNPKGNNSVNNLKTWYRRKACFSDLKQYT